MTSGPVCCYWQLYWHPTARRRHLVPPARYRRATRPGRTLCHALFRRRRGWPVIRVIYLASLVGGLITSVTSNNGFYNFPIGGLAAAALTPAMLVPRDAPWKAVAGQCGLLLSTVVLFCISAFGSVYGETSNPLTTPAVRIKDGVFAGQLTTTDQAAFITAATAVLGKQVGRGKTVVVMGRPSAIYLLTDASPMTLSTWDFWQFYGSLPPWVNTLTEAFYRVSVHRPDVVAVFNDPRPIRWRPGPATCLPTM